jgi:hypothetical protein
VVSIHKTSIRALGWEESIFHPSLSNGKSAPCMCMNGNKAE